MPLYEFMCTRCENIFPLVLTMEHEKTQPCEDCGAKSVKYFGNMKINVINPMTEPFYDYAHGEWIHSKRDMREMEKRTNSVCASDKELDQEADKNKAYIEKKEREKLEKFAEKTAHEILNKD